MELPHIGSWGLPDFGITERLSDAFGQGRTAQGGSNMQGNQSQTVLYPSGTTPSGSPTFAPAGQGAYGYNVSSTPQVRGASTQILPTTNTGTGGGGGGGGNGSMTEAEALARGIDINVLRREGKLIEPQNTGPSQSDIQAQQDRERGVIQAQQDRERGVINSGFQEIYSKLDQMMGLAPQYEQEDTRFINDQYGVESQARQNEYGANQQKLGTYRGDVANREKATLSSIATDMRNMLKAGNAKLGAMGAADSSAVPMYNYALSKQTGQRTADVRNQSNTQYGELDRKEIDLKSTFDTAMTSLASWKNEQLLNAKDRARALLERVQNAKIGADQSRLAALTNLEQGILTDVTNTVRQVEAEERANAKAIQNWATQRVAQLQDYKLNLQNSANFSPQALTYNALQGINYTGAPTDTSNYNPLLLKKKTSDPWS